MPLPGKKISTLLALVLIFVLALFHLGVLAGLVPDQWVGGAANDAASPPIWEAFFAGLLALVFGLVVLKGQQGPGHRLSRYLNVALGFFGGLFLLNAVAQMVVAAGFARWVVGPLALVLGLLLLRLVWAQAGRGS